MCTEHRFARIIIIYVCYHGNGGLAEKGSIYFLPSKTESDGSIRLTSSVCCVQG